MRLKDKTRVGWCEWVALPELGIRLLRAKIDTGACNSALHALDIRVDEKKQQVHFGICTLSHGKEKIIPCVAELVKSCRVKNSGGKCEERPMIHTLLRIGDEAWPIDISLTDRDGMRFPMLLGRSALHGLLVDPKARYLLDKPLAGTVRTPAGSLTLSGRRKPRTP